MINNTILEYISSERVRGVRDEDIRSALLASKWAEADVNEAFGLPATSSVPVISPLVPVSRVAPAFSWTYVKSLFEGRIGRWDYFFGGLLFSLVSNLVVFSLVFILGWGGNALGLYSGFEAIFFGIVCLFVLMIPFSLVGLGFSVRRFHDLGNSGLWLLVFFIPLVQIVLIIYLLFFKGEQSTNQYGPIEVYPRSIRGAWNAIFRKI